VYCHGMFYCLVMTTFESEVFPGGLTPPNGLQTISGSPGSVFYLEQIQGILKFFPTSRARRQHQEHENAMTECLAL